MGIVKFYQLIDGARPPQRADRSAAGTLPTRAYRYCDAVTTASGFGWWVFPPIDLQLLWDGEGIYWHYAGAANWLSLQPAAQFPHQAARFDAVAPSGLRGCSPPFLTALPEPGAVQIWTGLIARSAPDWSLLVRAPANLPLPGGYVLYEGVIETDRWFGPLFTNLRLTRTNQPVTLRADFPLAQVQPLPRLAYDDSTLDSMELVSGMDRLQPDDWADYYHTIVVPNLSPDRPLGSYAVAARRRRHKDRCPMHAGAAQEVLSGMSVGDQRVSQRPAQRGSAFG
ncbi:MAG: hypothetical protein JO122_16700 [Acetobacteraceae bacterium]|nr:hypothetical protein [Acetobacteraceae bacterium]